MAPSGRVSSKRMTLPVALAAGAAALLGSQLLAFLPAPGARVHARLRAGITAASAAPVLFAAAPAAMADQITDASKKFSDAAYPVAQKIDWGNAQTIAKYLATTSTKDPKGVAQALGQLLDVGLTMDPALVKTAVQAHERALKMAAFEKGLVTSPAAFAAVNEATARMIASADAGMFDKMRTAFPGNEELQMQLFKETDPAQAKKAYDAFAALTKTIKAASTNGANHFPTAAEETGGKIGAAAAKFSDASYPLLSKIDFGNMPTISNYIQTVAGKNPRVVAEAIEKTLEVGESMDPKLVGPAVKAHEVAIGSAIADPGFVASQADFAAVVDAMARMIGSADPGKFVALLRAFPGNADLQLSLMAVTGRAEAKEAFRSFFELTSAVKR